MSAGYCQPGHLDTSFGSSGKVTTDFGTGSNTGNAVVIQADGKIVVAGTSGLGLAPVGSSDMAVARYNSDGSLDNSFDGDGKATVAFGNSWNYGNAVAIQPDGKIVVAGYTTDLTQGQIAIARFNTNGSLDNSFSGDGKVTTTVAGVSEGYAIVLQPDGKIVVGGIANGYFTVARYNADGSLDNSFDGDGKLTLAFFSNNYDEVRSLAIQPDGKIIAAGVASGPNGYLAAIARLNSNGSLDNSFSGDGKETIDFGGGGDGIRSVLLQPDGKILVAGRSSSNDYILARLNSNGDLDNTFNGGGKAYTDFGNADLAFAVALQPDGKIIAAGESGNGTNYDFSMTRYNSDGSLDTSFNNDGKVRTDFGAYDRAKSIALQNDGKIILAGTAGNYFGVARYLITGLPNTVHQLSTTTTKPTIYPNPFRETLNIFSAVEGEVVLIDFTGKHLLTKRMNRGLTLIDCTLLPNGQYMLRVQSPDKIQSQLILKQ